MNNYRKLLSECKRRGRNGAIEALTDDDLRGNNFYNSLSFITITFINAIKDNHSM